MKKSKPSDLFNTGLIKDILDISSKVPLGLMAMCYVIGLVVVNVYLNGFGVYSLSLFRLSYIAAGLWASFFLVYPVLLVASLIANYSGTEPEYVPFTELDLQKREPDVAIAEPPDPTRTKGHIFDRIYSGIEDRIFGYLERLEEKDYLRQDWLSQVILFLLNLTLTAFWLVVISKVSTQSIWAAIYCSLIGLVLVVYILVGSLIVRFTSRLISRVGRISLMTLPALLIFAFYVYYFASHLYGQIPSFLGGGAPKVAQLVLGDAVGLKEKLQSVGVIFQPNSLTANVQILLVTDEEYILLIDRTETTGNSRVTLTLPRNEVQAVLYDQLDSEAPIKSQ